MPMCDSCSRGQIDARIDGSVMHEVSDQYASAVGAATVVCVLLLQSGTVPISRSAIPLAVAEDWRLAAIRRISGATFLQPWLETAMTYAARRVKEDKR